MCLVTHTRTHAHTHKGIQVICNAKFISLKSTISIYILGILNVELIVRKIVHAFKRGRNLFVRKRTTSHNTPNETEKKYCLTHWFRSINQIDFYHHSERVSDAIQKRNAFDAWNFDDGKNQGYPKRKVKPCICIDLMLGKSLKGIKDEWNLMQEAT